MPRSAHVGGSLADPRATLEVADVGRLIGEAASLYDAILLDAVIGTNQYILIPTSRHVA